jgi:hypothetical protein
MERRGNHRFDVFHEVFGSFSAHEAIYVKNMSMNGLNVLSSFKPVVGNSYLIHLNSSSNRKQSFKIQVVRAEVQSFNSAELKVLPQRIVFSSGAIFLDMTDDRRNFLISLLESHFKDLWNATVH